MSPHCIETECKRCPKVISRKERETVLQLGYIGMRAMHVPRLYDDRERTMSQQCMKKMTETA